MQPLEYESARETFYDFCLWPYEPAAAYENKLKSVNLLLQSFHVAGVGPRGRDLVMAIRQGLGPNRTVWGIKRFGMDLRWEFYFYDYRRKQRQTSVPRVLAFCRPFFACDVPIDESVPYFMFSVDIDPDRIRGARKVDEIHLYIGNPGSTVSSGICYSTTADGARLENFYFFFEARRQRNEIVAKLSCSVHYDAGRWPAETILWPELQDCNIIVIANKPTNDAVYFSGVRVDQLIVFLKRMKWDPSLVAFIENHRAMLDHLRYDVGFDYRIKGSVLQILKSACYGVF